MFQEVYNLKTRLKQSKVKGVALDIDETLSFTIGWLIEELQQKFGNPENLTVSEMITKYRYTHNVPYWQTDEVKSWLDESREADAKQELLPLIKNADTGVSELNKIVPIVAYITARPEAVINGTRNWIRKHALPDVEIIARPHYVVHSEGNRWKADVLNYLYPEVCGIVDDNPALLDYLPKSYTGKIFLYDCKSDHSGENVVRCSDWEDVVKKAKAVF